MLAGEPLHKPIDDAEPTGTGLIVTFLETVAVPQEPPLEVSVKVTVPVAVADAV